VTCNHAWVNCVADQTKLCFFCRTRLFISSFRCQECSYFSCQTCFNLVGDVEGELSRRHGAHIRQTDKVTVGGVAKINASLLSEAYHLNGIHTFRCAFCHVAIEMSVKHFLKGKQSRFCSKCAEARHHEPYKNSVIVFGSGAMTHEDVRRHYFQKALASWTAGVVLDALPIETYDDLYLMTAFLSLLIYNIMAPDPPQPGAVPGNNDRPQLDAFARFLTDFINPYPEAVCGIKIPPLDALLKSVRDTRMIVGTFGHGDMKKNAFEYYADRADLLERFQHCLLVAHFCHKWVLSRAVPFHSHAVIFERTFWHCYRQRLRDLWQAEWQARISEPISRATTASRTPHETDMTHSLFGDRLLALAESLANQLPDQHSGYAADGESSSSAHPDNVRNAKALLCQLAFHYGRAYLRLAHRDTPELDQTTANYIASADSAFVTELRHCANVRNAITVVGDGSKGNPIAVSIVDVDMFSKDIKVKAAAATRALLWPQRQQTHAHRQLPAQTIANTHGCAHSPSCARA
jgi:hypothetical protein